MMTFKEQYYKIIQYRQAHPLADDIFGEKHHIIPRSLGGSDEEENLIKLTLQEHYDCHELLPFMYLEEGNQYGYQKMLYAWNQISHTREGIAINAEQYAELREKYREVARQNIKKATEASHKSEKRKEALRNSEKFKQALKKAQEARSKPFEMDGIRFKSQRDAAKHFGVSRGTIRSWLNNPEKYNHVYKYL